MCKSKADEAKKPIRKISIEKFGALGNVSLQLNASLQIVIGPQTSGKSTLGKTIYFCRKIRDYFVSYSNEIMNGYYKGAYYTNFVKYLRNPFMGCFGTTKHMEKFVIEYYFDTETDKYVKITLDKDRYAFFQFSDKIKAQIEEVFSEAQKMANSRPKSFAEEIHTYQAFLELIKRRAVQIFVDDENLLYIPAGRNMLATVPDLIETNPENTKSVTRIVDISRTDLITQDFVRYIRQMRWRFGSKLEDITQNYLKTVKGEIRNKDVELACELVRSILKADYVCDSDGEKLYYENNKWVKLMFGSSGQQEVLWALNCIFLIILQNEKTFVVFEEPESHIFPDAQESIARLVALMINSSGSEVFLTTHSPYMLTAVNLLIYSGLVESSNDSPVIERQYRMKPHTVAAYLLPGCKKDIKSLTDSKRGLIDALQIDGVSEHINDQMDQLLYKHITHEKLGKRE